MITQEIKINFRDIIIIILVGVCLWLYFRPQKNNLKEFDDDNFLKQKELNLIQKQRDSLLAERKLIDLELLKQKNLSIKRSDTISYYKKISKFKENEIILLSKELRTYQEFFDKRTKEIDYLIQNPIILPKEQLIQKISEKL